MKKFTNLTIIALLIFISQSCTKDRVPNPSTLNKTQVTIYDQNFGADTSGTNFPAGWVASSGGWKIDTAITNASTGYTGATGGANCVISNPTTGSSGDFTVTSKSISTTHYQDITVTYGARRSKHFSDNGSSITSFAYSVDDGKTWTNVTYTENANDSNWYLINNGVRMSLGTDANNQSSVMFRWTAHVVVTPSGTYRIDDFQVLGTSM